MKRHIYRLYSDFSFMGVPVLLTRNMEMSIHADYIQEEEEAYFDIITIQITINNDGEKTELCSIDFDSLNPEAKAEITEMVERLSSL